MSDASDGAERRAEVGADEEDAYPSDAIESALDAPQDDEDAVTVVVDSREPEHVAPAVLTHPEVEQFIEHELAAADLVVNGVGFERKTASDFASSMLEDRLREQIEKLGEVYDHAYILLEGDLAEFDALDHTQLKAQSLRGMAASVTARHGIPVIPVGSLALLVDMAVRLGRKHTEGPSSMHLAGGAVGSDEPIGKRMWGVLPDIGPELANRLYDALGTPVEFVERSHGGMTESDVLQSVDGIGEVTAERVLGALRGQDV